MDNQSAEDHVREWLAEMGRNADAVYQTLRNAGTKGIPTASYECPVAVYLNKKIKDVDQCYYVLVGEAFVTIKTWAGPNRLHVADVIISRGVREFIKHFDGDRSFAPELREDEV